MTGSRDDAGVIEAIVDRPTPGPADLAAGNAVVRSVATNLLSPLLAGRPGGNVAFSPLSIALALGMLRAGAQGDSAAELDALFGLERPALPTALNAVDQRLARLDGGQPKAGAGFDSSAHLSLANALWGQRGITWHEPFLSTLAADYGAGMHIVDYTSDPEVCRLLINGWVGERTHGRIPHLLEPGTVTDDHRLVLTNALWFKAAWLHTFLDAPNGPFTTTSGECLDVPRMSASPELLGHQRGDGWQTLRIPYVGGHLAMTLVLPDPGDEESVESYLATPHGLLTLLQPAQERTVRLTMPTFDLDTATDLRAVLSSIGVASPFIELTGDFAPMTADEVLSVDRVVHQATVTVDRHGTEAAAATAVMARRTSGRMPVDPITIVVDRPFYFAITTIDDALPLFLGRVNDPTSK
jgi:serpin B